jgi:hypothetical protein
MTWRLLLDWGKGPTDGERFSADLLSLEGFRSIDPSHPLGGPDSLKDLCDLNWSQQSTNSSTIRSAANRRPLST